MATLDNLPADQRAVLQLVLQRGRSYDEIARLLSMDRAAVRERALSAFDALGPQTGVSDQRRALITDYLLGQLPPAVATEVRDYLSESPSARAWARVLASELNPLTSNPMPEIPTASTRGQAPVPPRIREPDEEPEDGPRKPRESILLRRRRARRAERPETAPASAHPSPAARPSRAEAHDESGAPRRSSRLGGAILIGLGVLVVAAVVALVVGNSGNGKHHSVASSSSTTTPSAAASGTTTAGSSSGAHVVSQVNLKPTSKKSKAAGIAEVLKEGASDGIAIVAQNVPPNSTKPPNAYAVWLYNSTSDAHFLGFVNPGVSSNGRLSTAGGLPANAAHYKQLIVTVETTSHPKSPGTIILAGPLNGL